MIVQRLENVCHCVEKGEWPIRRLLPPTPMDDSRSSTPVQHRSTPQLTHDYMLVSSSAASDGLVGVRRGPPQQSSTLSWLMADDPTPAYAPRDYLLQPEVGHSQCLRYPLTLPGFFLLARCLLAMISTLDVSGSVSLISQCVHPVFQSLDDVMVMLHACVACLLHCNSEGALLRCNCWLSSAWMHGSYYGICIASSF